MNNPSASEYPIDHCDEHQRPHGPEPGLFPGPAARERLTARRGTRSGSTPSASVPSSRDRTPARRRQTLQTMQYYAGTQTSASTAAAVEPDHHRDGLADVGEHDRHIHQHPAEWRANRPDQVTMPTLVAEFVDVSKTYRAPLHRGRTVQALRGVSFGIEPGEVLRAAGPQPGRQDDPAQDPPGLVPSERRPRVPAGSPALASGAPSPASATCTRTRRFPVT